MRVNETDFKALIGRTALICEDESITAGYLKLVLKKAGMRVIGVVADGESCVAEVLRKRPDLVLIDINLPADIDGTEAARRIFLTSRVYRPCVIMVTAYADEEHRQEALDAGVNGYVVKPFTPHGLLEEITSVMKSPHCSSEETRSSSEPGAAAVA